MSLQKAVNKKLTKAARIKAREEANRENQWFQEQISSVPDPVHQSITRQALKIYRAIDKRAGYCELVPGDERKFTLGLGKNDGQKPYTPRKVVDMMLNTFEWNANQSFGIFGMPERALDLAERGIKDVTVLVIEDSQGSFAKIVAKVLGYKYSTIEDAEKQMRKFDVIIGNPPYNGTLHMEFFNKAVDWIPENGAICFIQPATPYYFAKEWSKRGNGDPKGPMMQMRANIKKYQAKVSFHVGIDIFTQNGLDEISITTFIKTPGNLDITYTMINETYKNVSFADINIHHINPVVYHAIREKYTKFIEKNGSLYEYQINKIKNDDAKYVRIWGIGTRDTMRPNLKCCMIPIKGQYEKRKGSDIPSSNQGMGGQKEGSWSGIPLNLLQDVDGPSFYSYVKTAIARFGLGLSKIDVHIDSGELKTVPLVPFDRHWTDEELAVLIGLTDDELEVIYNAIPDCYKLRVATLDSFVEE